MITKIINFGKIDVTHKGLKVDNVIIKTNFEMSLILKATGWFKDKTLYELQEMGYTKMYNELINEATKRGLL